MLAVKGLWWNRPDDWPLGVPYCDPNNSKLTGSDGTLSKPKKETLIQMFEFLMTKYNVSHEFAPLHNKVVVVHGGVSMATIDLYPTCQD